MLSFATLTSGVLGSAQLSELEDVVSLRWKGGSSPVHTQFKEPLEGSCPCIGRDGQ